MKKIILSILLSFISIGMFAQFGISRPSPRKMLKDCVFDKTGGAYSLTGIDTVPNTKAGELYNRAFKWVVKTYKNPEFVIRAKDKDAGIIVLYGIFNDDFKGRLTLDFKDNRYKWTISEMVAMLDDEDEPIEKNFMFDLFDGGCMKIECYNYITSLRNAMHKKGDDW